MRDHVADYDLPEPRRASLSETERRERQARALRAGLFVAIGYALLHKVIVPVFLRLTPLAATPFARIDVWAVHSLLLALALTERYREGSALSFLSGAGVVYAIYEFYELVLGRLPGWLSISRLVSSIPIGIGCAMLLASPVAGRHPRWAWGGALGLAAFLAILELTGRTHGL